MKLSIIIPTYNSSKTLRQTLNSILSQTFNDYEVLIMDGMSKDNTVSICQSYKDSRIKVFSESDKGIYDAMNKGITMAMGDWLFFLGSDDYLLSANVLMDVFKFESSEISVLYGDVEASHLTPYHRGEWNRDFLIYNRCHQCIFYRKEIFDKYGYYKIKYKVCADHDINLQWFLSSTIRSMHIPVIVAHFSSGGISDEKNGPTDPLFCKDFYYLLLKYGFASFSWKERTKFLVYYLRHYMKFRKSI